MEAVKLSLFRPIDQVHRHGARKRRIWCKFIQRAALRTATRRKITFEVFSNCHRHRIHGIGTEVALARLRLKFDLALLAGRTGRENGIIHAHRISRSTPWTVPTIRQRLYGFASCSSGSVATTDFESSGPMSECALPSSEATVSRTRLSLGFESRHPVRRTEKLVCPLVQGQLGTFKFILIPLQPIRFEQIG